MPLQRRAEPHHAALAADAADLEGLRPDSHSVEVYGPLDQVPAGGFEPLRPADLEQAVALAAVESDDVEQLLGPELARVGADAVEQLRRELGHLDGAAFVGMDEGRARAEARRGPAVLVVDDAETEVPYASRLGERVRAERLEERDESRR